MWKIVVGFIAFAALALFLLNKGGDLDMGGEKHGRGTADRGEQTVSLAAVNTDV